MKAGCLTGKPLKICALHGIRAPAGADSGKVAELRLRAEKTAKPLTFLTGCATIDKPLITGFLSEETPPPNSEIKKRQVPQFMYAVIETGGKQYKVENGDVVFVEKLAAEEESTVEFKVVAIGGEEGLKVGTPYVDGASVSGKVLKNGKGKKITVFTYKPKKSEKRKMGHRQPYTKVQIEAINA